MKPRIGTFSSFLAVAATLVCADLPTGVQPKPFYDNQAIKFTNPVWFGEFPGAAGTFLVGEAQGGLKILEPDGAGYRQRTFGSVPAAFFAGNDGLLGLAFHPAFPANGLYYVCYNPVRGEITVEERRASADRLTDAGVARTLFKVPLTGVVHNGGDMHFGPDGFLYVAFGDAGNPNVYNQRSQDLSILPGKMLRIDVDRKDPGMEYAIPADNPYAAVSGTARREIWASGLRQPWRWSFDVDGRIIVGDVGDWVEEEVDVIRKGGDYGWSRMEGLTCFNKDRETSPLASCDTAGLIPPVAVVPHTPISTAPTACIIGGYVFRGDAASPFYGAYIFGDFETRKLFGIRFDQGLPAKVQQIGILPTLPSAFGMDRLGNLYVLGYNNGVIYKLEHAALIGKGVGIRPGKAREALRGPRIAGGRIQATDWPAEHSFSITDGSGRLLRRYAGTQVAAGVALNLPSGAYMGFATDGAASVRMPILIP